MIKIKQGSSAIKKRKKILKLAKGYRGLNSRSFIFAKEQIVQSLNYAYIGRKLKKRIFRKLWITRINSIIRLLGFKYSNFIGLLRKKNMLFNRKILANIIFDDFSLFKKLVTLVLT